MYGPDSEAWALNRESMLLLGAGPRALLLQIAHPAVAAGVDEHSDFRADPWRRLAGTLKSYLTIVYGTAPVARAEIRRLNALHRGIVGTGYSARDPELSLWVHATLVDSTLVANDRWIEPLTRERRERAYQETRPIGRAFGVPEALLPKDLDAFEAYVAGMLAPDGPVKPGPLARDLAAVILHPPLAPLLPSAAPLLDRIPPATYSWTLWPSLGLLPTVGARGVRVRAGVLASGSCRRGSSRAGVPGDRSSRGPGGRCRRRWPPMRALARSAPTRRTCGNRRSNIVDHRSSGVAASSASSSERVPAIS